MLSDLQLLILAVLSMADSWITYEWIIFVRKKYKKMPLEKLEDNKLVRICWNNFGLVKGSIVSAILLFVIQALLSSIHKYVFFAIVAILIFVIYNHINSFIVFSKREKEKNRKKNNRKRKNNKAH